MGAFGLGAGWRPALHLNSICKASANGLLMHFPPNETRKRN